MLSPLDHAAYDGMTKRLERFFVAIIDGRDREATLSGVKVTSHGRHFVVTAGHYFDDKSVEELEQIHVVTARRCLTMSPTRGAFRATRPMRYDDVGVITLPPDEAMAFGGEWIDAETLDSSPLVAGSGQLVCALGVPDARLEWLRGDVPTPGANRWPLVLANLGRLRPVSLLTEVSGRPPTSEVVLHPNGLDVLLEYPNAADGRDEEIATLRGMSGAGVFTVPFFEEGKLWKPSDAVLVAILTEQYLKNREARFLQCQRIEVARKAVAEALKECASARL